MGSERDEFPRPVRDTLAKRAGQRCSNPDCSAITSGPHEDETKAVNLGVAAHITAAAPGGPRYNQRISQEERASSSNAIWLCQYCAKLIDSDTRRFSEERLTIWKRKHEEFIKKEMISRSPDADSRKGIGILNISTIYTNSPADGRSCIVDIRADNRGLSDIFINSVEFRVLEFIRRFPLGSGLITSSR